MIRYFTMAWLALVLAGVQDAVGDMPSAGSPQDRKELFAQEMAAVEKDPDRMSRVARLRKALSYRPDHRDNLAIEYRICIELSQRSDPERGDHPTRANRVEALAVYEHILQTYSHMDYHRRNRRRRGDRSKSMQLMMPEAALQAASLERGLNGNAGTLQNIAL